MVIRSVGPTISKRIFENRNVDSWETLEGTFSARIIMQLRYRYVIPNVSAVQDAPALETPDREDVAPGSPSVESEIEAVSSPETTPVTTPSPRSLEEADVTPEWEFDCHVDGTGCHALEGGWTKLWKDCVNAAAAAAAANGGEPSPLRDWNATNVRYPCPGQGCTKRLTLDNDSHGAHVRLKRRWDLEDADRNKWQWEHAYVVIPTCSKCNTSYNDLTRECIAVKVADLDKKVYVGSITQDGHTVHKLENVEPVVEFPAEDVEGSVGLKHLDDEQLKVLKKYLIVWLFEDVKLQLKKKLSTEDIKLVEGSTGLRHLTEEQLEVLEKNLIAWFSDVDPGSLFSKVRILFSRLMVNRGKGNDILKLLKPQKIDLLNDEAKEFGKHSGLSSLVVRDLDKKLMESCREKRGAFKLTGTKNTHEYNTRQKKSERVTLNFDNDATDSFIKKLVTPPSTPWSEKELEEWKNRSKKPEEWKVRANIVLEVRGEQFPETTASDVIEHLKKILKEVIHKREAFEEALKEVKEYCEKDPSEIIESLSSVSLS